MTVAGNIVHNTWNFRMLSFWSWSKFSCFRKKIKPSSAGFSCFFKSLLYMLWFSFTFFWQVDLSSSHKIYCVSWYIYGKNVRFLLIIYGHLVQWITWTSGDGKLIDNFWMISRCLECILCFETGVVFLFSGTSSLETL